MSCLTFGFEFLKMSTTFSLYNLVTTCSNAARRCFSLSVIWNEAPEVSSPGQQVGAVGAEEERLG